MSSVTRADIDNLKNYLQKIVLAENLSSNTELRSHALLEKNAKLETSTKTVIGAINELVRRVNTETKSNRQVIMSLLRLVGDPYLHPNLVDQVLRQSTSLTQMVLDMTRKINEIKNASRTIYYQVFSVTNNDYLNNFTYKLDHVPLKESVKFILNGVTYVKGFIVNPDECTVQWVDTKEASGASGITPEVDSSIMIEYVGIEVED